MIIALKNLVFLLWQDLINLIHIFEPHDSAPSIHNHSKELRKAGIIKISDFLVPDFSDNLRNEIELLANTYKDSIELENGTKLNYRNQNNADGSDHGMLDISHVQNSITSISQIDQKYLIQIIKSTSGQEVIPLRANAYLNIGVKNTRGYHLDNVQPVIYKAFIYLSDVPDITYGPYSFIRNSHRFCLYSYFNIIRNLFIQGNKSTDMPWFSRKNVEHCTGKKGDLILSNQNAIHRGLAQEVGKKRVAIILSFMVKSKLSYMHNSAKDNIKNSIAHTSNK